MIGSIEIFNAAIMLLPLYVLGTKKLNFLIYPTLAAPIPFILNEALNLHWFDFVASRRLIIAYGLIGVVFIFTMIYRYRWNYTQALPVATILVMAGSYYWEIPYLIRNAFLLGFEWDWILHVGGIVPFIALFYLLGTEPRMYTSYKIMFATVGVALSVLLMVVMPVPPGPMPESVWDSYPYLLNRVVDTSILFIVFNTSTPPTKGVLYHDGSSKTERRS